MEKSLLLYLFVAGALAVALIQTDWMLAASAKYLRVNAQEKKWRVDFR